MKIYELLDELIEEIEGSPKSVFSNKRSVDIEILMEIISDLKAAIPNEIKEAEHIINERDQMMSKAKEEAASIIASAEDELQIRVADDRVVQEAEIKAKELLGIAENNAREISLGAKEYADDILNEVEEYLSNYLEVIRKNRLELSGKRKN
ncbi:MAG: ATPase [Christensenellales bacterium]|jgi:vacuolar-type H+-ATPase subunit H